MPFEFASPFVKKILVRLHARETQIIQSSKDVFIALLISFLALWFFLGLNILNTGNVAWLEGKDMAAHFLGWHFFRTAEWSLPLGENPSYGIGFSSNILNSDSIPIVSVFLKLLSPWLPEIFQFQGWWILVSLFLQSLIALKIGRSLNLSKVNLVSLAVVITASPILFWRVYLGHLTLVAHFVILAGIYLYLKTNDSTKNYKWPVLLGITVGINPYLVVMVGVIWSASVARRLLERNGGNRPSLIEIIATLSTVVFAATIFGYFQIDNVASSSGFGKYKTNVLSGFDSNGWSRFLEDLPGQNGEHEGFAYLGLGVLLLILASVFYLKWQSFRRLLIEHLPIAVGALLLLLFAVSNQIGLATAEIGLPLPRDLVEFLNTFRSSGRMVWPAWYLVVFTCFRLLGQVPRKLTTAIVVAATALQMVDISAARADLMAVTSVNPSEAWGDSLHGRAWEKVALKYSTISTFFPENRAPDWKRIAFFAGTNGMATNMVAVSRVDDKVLEEERSRIALELSLGQLDPDTAWVLPERLDKSLSPELLRSGNGTLLTLDGITLYLPKGG